MFVRKKRNKSGSISVQVINKDNGYKVVATIGASHDANEIERLVIRGRQFIKSLQPPQPYLFPNVSHEDQVINAFVDSLSSSQIHTIGPELIFGTLFDRIGFNAIPDEMFRHITMARLAYPVSKLKTVDYLSRYRGIQKSVDEIYLFLDRLAGRHKGQAETVAYEYTKRRLGKVSIVFYDMTTLYFEAEDEDDFRKIGFSKDGKFQHPQIMLGLLVGERGLPIGYDIYEGNTFEGKTLLPFLENIQRKHGFEKPVVVADAGLLSKRNLQNLSSEQYKFIIGARLKNEDAGIQQKVLGKRSGMKDGDTFVIQKAGGVRLVVGYSTSRAKKDAANREKGLRKLRTQLKTDRLTKEHINKRGYNKFLTITGNATVALDEEKVKEDERWDGLKGYLTNTLMPSAAIIENYKHLWQIERAFRISKTDLRVRPVFHRLRRRIEAHICVAFVAYTIYKELELLLAAINSGMSSKRAAELTHTMYSLTYRVPDSGEEKQVTLKMSDEQQIVYRAVFGG
ncbi:MAG: transposase [Elusimicrobia bacterium GWA2_56_46]|jgi:transposase|nr:MAG: transposase [Elusimicrobia bacterium GWA2_56_46]HBB66606.1 IS1634 family transposase [Elusimicrobiota bacterium]